MNKHICIITNIILLLWFFLDMIGMNIGNKILVSIAYKEDGIFFIIYLAVFICFIVKDSIGKYLLGAWLLLWFVAQFFSHWYFTIIGASEEKLRYFKDTIKLIYNTDRYIPDLYHIILHVLILLALVCLILYWIKSSHISKANRIDTRKRA
jgi:hypothetical protein